MIYLTLASAESWCTYLNSRKGFVPVAVHACPQGWTIY